jgi:hypothetical protein
MQTVGQIIFWFIVLVIFSSLRARELKRQRIRDAYKWQKPQIHGQRKFASRTDLWKAGLL